MTDTERWIDWTGGNDVLWSVFGNELIWKCLAQYLNYEDLRECRSVCTEFNRKTLAITDYINRTCYAFPAWASSTGNAEVIRTSWKHVSIDLDHLTFITEQPGSYVMGHLDDYLGHVESLRLRQSNSQRPLCGAVLQKVLLAPKTLRKLSTDVSLLAKANSETVVTVQNVLLGLAELEITSSNNELLDSYKFRSAVDSILALLACAKNLCAFHLPQCVKEHRFGPTPADVATAQRLLSAIINNSALTLENVTLQDVLIWGVMATSNVALRMPKLKSLKIRARRADSSAVAQFLLSHPFISELDVCISGSLQGELFRAIERIGPNLKVLRITCSAIEWEEPSKWKYLKSTQLTEFSFHLQRGSVPLSRELMLEFLAQLPPTLRKLRLRGLNRQRRELDAFIPDFKCLNPMLLTELDLSRVKRFVTDATAEYICRQFKQLRELDISNSRCTDYGLTGISSNDGTEPFAGFSISDIKGLRKLGLQQCAGLTDRALTDAIKFLELYELDLRGNEQFSNTAVKQVLKNNPSLRYLKTTGLERRSSRESLEKERAERCQRRKFVYQAGPGDDSDDDEPRRSSSHVVIYSETSDSFQDW